MQFYIGYTYFWCNLLFLLLVLPSHTCGNPGEINKGVLHGTRFNIGDKIRYNCLAGYILEGHSTLTCIVSPGNGASWDFPSPFCRGKRFHLNMFVPCLMKIYNVYIFLCWNITPLVVLRLNQVQAMVAFLLFHWINVIHRNNQHSDMVWSKFMKVLY